MPKLPRISLRKDTATGERVDLTDRDKYNLTRKKYIYMILRKLARYIKMTERTNEDFAFCANINCVYFILLAFFENFHSNLIIR